MTEFGRSLKEDTGAWHEHLFMVIYKPNIVTTVVGSGFIDQIAENVDFHIRPLQEVFSFSDRLVTVLDQPPQEVFTFIENLLQVEYKDRFTQEGYTQFQEGITATINPLIEKTTSQPQDSFTFLDRIIATKIVTITTTVSGGTFTDGTQTADIFTR